MIEVTHNILPGIGVIEVHGHAGAGQFGEDAVCAAASCLMQTLGLLTQRTELRSGYARAVYSRRARKERDAAEFALRGLRWLAEEYPEFVTCREARGDG